MDGKTQGKKLTERGVPLPPIGGRIFFKKKLMETKSRKGGYPPPIADGIQKFVRQKQRFRPTFNHKKLTERGGDPPPIRVLLSLRGKSGLFRDYFECNHYSYSPLQLGVYVLTIV